VIQKIVVEKSIRWNLYPIRKTGLVITDLRSLNLIQKKINPGDIIFLYFTGHGTNNAVITEDYKLLYNFEIKNNY